MHRPIATALAALALTSGATRPEQTQEPRPAFSFSQCALPSLMDINVHQKFRVASGKGRWQLTNVHPSFSESFVLFHDESRQAYIIQDRNGRTRFEGDLDGVPRYVGCVDIDRDGDPDVLVELAAYGNHGNGSENFVVLLNDHGRLTRLSTPIQFEFNGGQESKAGVLTWYSARTFCAIFIGEEADVTGSGTDVDPIQVGQIRKVKEVWGHQNGQMRLLSKSSVPIERTAVQYMTFR